MAVDLTKRHRDALHSLQRECDFEDAHRPGDMRFVAKGCINGGEKILGDLVAWGFAIIGQRHAHADEGYRITLTGRAALKAPPPAPKPRRASLKMLAPLVPTMQPRIKPQK